MQTSPNDEVNAVNCLLRRAPPIPARRRHRPSPPLPRSSRERRRRRQAGPAQARVVHILLVVIRPRRRLAVLNIWVCRAAEVARPEAPASAAAAAATTASAVAAATAAAAVLFLFPCLPRPRVVPLPGRAASAAGRRPAPQLLLLHHAVAGRVA
jgi:hypothetical protein